MVNVCLLPSKKLMQGSLYQCMEAATIRYSVVEIAAVVDYSTTGLSYVMPFINLFSRAD